MSTLPRVSKELDELEARVDCLKNRLGALADAIAGPSNEEGSSGPAGEPLAPLGLVTLTNNRILQLQNQLEKLLVIADRLEVVAFDNPNTTAGSAFIANT